MLFQSASAKSEAFSFSPKRTARRDFKSKSLENALLGHKLPLTHKDIENIQEQVEQEFQKAATDQMISDVVRQQFFNLCRYSFEQLT